MTITKKFDINSIEDYQLAIKLNASVFIREPDNDLIENFQDFLKTHSLIPSIEYDENGYNLYLGTLMNRHDYRLGTIIGLNIFLTQRQKWKFITI